ncbi:hypothetical protein [Blastococcus sp. VKM Ac-2987]|uniref:hypothetical protein n=1 Tax=Blastococcus sp. VKM Ac-2987 TaxID=3004141 RepID=UPI0022AB509B|nr:hypothetical protein [Blastococcus sp. VKM Ac-2987]MCZ2857428.1 hypothetical protein [Blastococcus sp. VKM Ac-2987]
MTSTGARSVWAAEGAEGLVLPWWLAILLAVIAAVAPVVTGWLTYQAAAKKTASDSEAAKDTHTLESSKSDRQLILQALEFARSDDATTRRQGWALLSGLSKMSGLSPDDGVLIQTLTRPLVERRLSEGRTVEEIDNDEVGYVYLIDEDEEVQPDEDREGDAAGS